MLTASPSLYGGWLYVKSGRAGTKLLRCHACIAKPLQSCLASMMRQMKRLVVVHLRELPSRDKFFLRAKDLMLYMKMSLQTTMPVLIHCLLASGRDNTT